MTGHSLQHVVAYLRSFLRYCHDHGAIDACSMRLRRPGTYRGELPPRALDWSMVQALIRSIDLHSKAGWRDQCILHLMAHYGLRPSEVALREDLDQLGGRRAACRPMQDPVDLLLPLAPWFMRLLRDHLAHERRAQGTDYPSCSCAHAARAAHWNITRDRRHLQEGAFGSPIWNCRTTTSTACDTFAMRLLTRGGRHAIGDLLGHHSLESTCTYLRLDTEMLRGVALEVPEADLGQGDGHA